MSIERNQRELSSLERILKTKLGFEYVSLFNAFQGSIHAALLAQGYFYNSPITIGEKWKDTPIQLFLEYLGLKVTVDLGVPADQVGPYRCIDMKSWNEGDLPEKDSATIVDLTQFGYGPAAAFLTQKPSEWEIAERLKIFGQHDLKTMWEQQEVKPPGPASVQFNYRLSPIVASLIRSQIGGLHG